MLHQVCTITSIIFFMTLFILLSIQVYLPLLLIITASIFTLVIMRKQIQEYDAVQQGATNIVVRTVDTDIHSDPCWLNFSSQPISG